MLGRDCLRNGDLKTVDVWFCIYSSIYVVCSFMICHPFVPVTWPQHLRLGVHCSRRKGCCVVQREREIEKIAQQVVSADL